MTIKVFYDCTTAPFGISWRGDNFGSDFCKQRNYLINRIDTKTNAGSDSWLRFGSQRINFEDQA